MSKDINTLLFSPKPGISIPDPSLYEVIELQEKTLYIITNKENGLSHLVKIDATSLYDSSCSCDDFVFKKSPTSEEDKHTFEHCTCKHLRLLYHLLDYNTITLISQTSKSQIEKNPFTTEQQKEIKSFLEDTL